MTTNKTIVLIACSGKKERSDVPIEAERLYTGQLFKKSLEYAKSIAADKIFILSAKHHLVELDDKLEYYDCYLKQFKKQEKIEWSNKVIEQLKSKTNLASDRFIILAGKNYNENLLDKISVCDLPLKGLRIGEQLQTLSQMISKQNNRKR